MTTRTRSPAAPTARWRRQLEQRRSAVRSAYHSRHRSLTHLHDLSTLLAEDGDGSVRVWIHEAIAERLQSRAENASKIASLRASIVGVSPVLLAACHDEHLPIAVVAQAAVPFAEWPGTHEGWPSTAEGEPSIIEPHTDASAIMRDIDRDRAVGAFMDRNRYDGVIARGLEHRLGGWAASVRHGILGTEINRGGARLRTVRDRGTLVVAARLPQSMLSAVRGRPVSDIVDHPALRDPDLVATSARVDAESTTIRFRCPPVTADFEALTRDTCQIKSACDVALQAEHTLLCLLAVELRSIGVEAPASVLHRNLEAWILADDSLRHPGGDRLEAPSIDWVTQALRPNIREMLHRFARRC